MVPRASRSRSAGRRADRWSDMEAGRRGTTVFLTGATGFIGGRLARALDARGYRLRCLVRRPERAAPLAALGAELLVGDVTDPDIVARGLAHRSEEHTSELQS